jgi:hypothetical protein
MPSIIQTSFSAGELSPTMFGRVDLAKYHVGLAKCRNFFVDYRGGVTSRPGTEYCGRAKSANARLYSFQFNTEQTYVMEFGDGYMRLFQNGAPILETGFAITDITLGATTTIEATGHNFAVGDWIYFAGSTTTEINTRTYVVGSVATNSFTITEVSGAAVDSSSWTPWTSGGTAYRIYTLSTPYAEDDLPTLRMVQSQDVVTITHKNYRPRNLSRLGNTNWTLTTIDFDAQIEPPATVTLTLNAVGADNAYFSYCVTAVDADTGEESVASDVKGGNGLNISVTAGSHKISWTRVANAAYYNVYKAQVSPALDLPIGSSYGYIGTAYGLELVDGNIIPDFTKVPPTRRDPFAPGQILSVAPTSAGTGYVQSSTTASLSDTTGTGAEIQPIVTGGGVTAYLVIKPGKNYTNPTVVISGAGSGAAATAEVGESTGTDPAVSCYFQQRRIYGASENNPMSIWASRPGAFDNMDISIPTLANDALSLTLSASQVNEIKALQPMPGGLVVLTSGGAWQVSGGGNGEPISAVSVVATPQAFNGANDVPPIPINFEILYVQSKGSTVRNLSYNFFNNIYTGTDLSVLSNHLFVGHTIKEWAWAEEPFKIVWLVRDDGQLLTLTFLKEHEVAGWAHSDTTGLFSSITVIREGEEDVPYFIVKRRVNGSWVSMIERMKSRYIKWNLAEDAWCLDCALELTLEEPEAGISVSAATGAVTITADSAVFDADSVGRVIRVGGGIIDITGHTSASTVTGTVRSEILDIVEGTEYPRPFLSGEWKISTPVTELSGLEYLEGETISVVADGSYVGDQVVTDGTITLPSAASRIIAGFKFTCDMQTMPIDTGQPTTQGRRKKISALTLIVDKTRGLSSGHNFDDMFEIKELRLGSQAYGIPVELSSARQRIILPPQWEVEGQLCVRQEFPMPATVLAVIPELTPGDLAQ